jgi:hypothetical protein
MRDYTKVWEALNQGQHVLLLVDVPDAEQFNSRVEVIASWFAKIVKERHGAVDFRMLNNTFLCVRRLVNVPAYPGVPNMKVMVDR